MTVKILKIAMEFFFGSIGMWFTNYEKKSQPYLSQLITFVDPHITRNAAHETFTFIFEVIFELLEVKESFSSMNPMSFVLEVRVACCGKVFDRFVATFHGRKGFV